MYIVQVWCGVVQCGWFSIVCEWEVGGGDVSACMSVMWYDLLRKHGRNGMVWYSTVCVHGKPLVVMRKRRSVWLMAKRGAPTFELSLLHMSKFGRFSA